MGLEDPNIGGKGGDGSSEAQGAQGGRSGAGRIAARRAGGRETAHPRRAAGRQVRSTEVTAAASSSPPRGALPRTAVRSASAGAKQIVHVERRPAGRR